MRNATICLLVVLLGATSSVGQSATTRGHYPQVVAKVHLTGQTAAIPPTTLVNPKKDGFYRVSVYIASTYIGYDGQKFGLTMTWTDDAAVVNFLDSFECPFRLHYDPRQEAEDRAVRDAMAGYMDGLMRLPEPLGHGDIYRGMEIGIPSHDELGLQLVDVFAGEFRDFFRNNGEALTEGATSMLITTMSDEPLQQFQDVGDRHFKSGVLTPMSAGLLHKLKRRNTRHILSYFYPVLAAGNLTCVTLNGQERLLEIPTGMIFDLLD